MSIYEPMAAPTKVSKDKSSSPSSVAKSPRKSSLALSMGVNSFILYECVVMVENRQSVEHIYKKKKVTARPLYFVS